ncbi:SpoU rRNA Methylase family protein [Catalinimonas alkaloidigena]|uniref:SpoU rRNA Methylase family protein n=1 Tax=Catalinimonas alkaloidigena TaxID=1075417 RepID=A0A1G9M5F5_9BACT|nr:RNA methyltransferase [Catalinimonas alkaloidigena]SDL68915.1 SpoU rRNA Methylase family protein [Catalinimonas alkaloidigena]
MRKLSNEELDRPSVADFKSKEKNPFVLVLDNVRSLLNVGSVFRTADAFLAERVILCGITGRPPHREINKTALGATESVVWEYVEDTLAAIEQLRAEGYQIASLEQADQSVMLSQFTPDPAARYAFVLGHEVGGVRADVVAASDLCLEIPQGGTKHSLNVSVAAGVVAWDYVSKTRRFE